MPEKFRQKSGSSKEEEEEVASLLYYGFPTALLVILQN